LQAAVAASSQSWLS